MGFVFVKRFRLQRVSFRTNEHRTCLLAFVSTIGELGYVSGFVQFIRRLHLLQSSGSIEFWRFVVIMRSSFAVLVRQRRFVSTTMVVRCTHRASILSEAMEQLVRNRTQRHDEIMQEITLSPNLAPRLGKELSQLTGLASLVQRRNSLEDEVASMKELIQEAVEMGDNEVETECQTELVALQQRLEVLEKQLVNAILPNDDQEDDDGDAIVEVRAGTGGDEASLFAAELLGSYVQTALAMKWKVEKLSEGVTNIGGVREAAVSISGAASFRPPTAGGSDEEETPLVGPYGTFKYESGVHRVQRVPINDSRIHTSACSVAVLPSLPASSHDLVIPTSELKIETMRASGAGGQHVNTTDSAVRITHLPTGIAASIQDERSQHKNKEKALKLIAARVRDMKRQEEDRTRGETRGNLMGGGDRSERIRTYNYPQDRVTDHRSKDTKHGIDGLLAGGDRDGLVVSFLPALKAMRRDELLRKLEDDIGAR